MHSFLLFIGPSYLKADYPFCRKKHLQQYSNALEYCQSLNYSIPTQVFLSFNVHCECLYCEHFSAFLQAARFDINQSMGFLICLWQGIVRMEHCVQRAPLKNTLVPTDVVKKIKILGAVIKIHCLKPSISLLTGGTPSACDALLHHDGQWINLYVSLLPKIRKSILFWDERRRCGLWCIELPCVSGQCLLLFRVTSPRTAELFTAVCFAFPSWCGDSKQKKRLKGFSLTEGERDFFFSSLSHSN